MSAPDLPPPPVIPMIQPEPDSRLEQLAAEYWALKPLADEYAERLETIKNGLKAEMAAAAPGQSEVLLSCQYLPSPLRLTARSSWRLDTKALKSEAPELYVKYARRSTSWRLELAG